MPVRRRRRLDIVLPVSSMGDIAFLLIIFFVLSSNFMKSANIDAERPSSEDAVPAEDANVSVALDREGRMYVQGVEVSESELESAVLQAVGEEKSRPVHLLVDRNLVRAKYMPAIGALASAGVKVIMIGDRK